MCTMTWFVTNEGYELFFNRDERLSRSHAEPPVEFESNGVNYLSPTDADAGGTWIAANHYGVTVCLLNHYQYEQIATYKDWISRGEIVRQFATTTGPIAAEQQFRRLELDDYRAFRMFIIEPSGQNCLCVWDGHQARVERNVFSPKSSSSVDAQHVKTLRKELFKDIGLNASKDTQQFLNYHASHSPNRSQESVCMHRDDAKTVSLSHVRVSQTELDFAYADGSPCEASLDEGLTIKLVVSPANEKSKQALVGSSAISL